MAVGKLVFQARFSKKAKGLKKRHSIQELWLMIPGAFQNIFVPQNIYLNFDGHCNVDMLKWQLIETSK